MDTEKIQIYNKKLIGVSFFLLFVIIFVVGFGCVINSHKSDQREDDYSAIINDAKSFNAGLAFSNAGKDENNEAEEVVPELFTNGKQAFLYAYDLLKNYESYTMVSNGKTTSSQVGFDKSVANEVEFYKYSSDEFINIVEKYELPSTINLGLTSATYEYYKGNVKYTKGTKSLSYQNKKINSIFPNGNFTVGSYSKIPDAFCYEISSSTIVKATKFEVVKNSSGNIYCYNCTVVLNNGSSIREYAKKIQKEANAQSLPSFKSIVLDATLDKYGNFITIKACEQYDMKINGLITASCFGELYYNFSDYNKQPKFSKPNIN